MAEFIRILQPPTASPPLSPPKPPWILSSHLKPTPPRSIPLASSVQLHRKPCFISSRLVRFRPLTASSIDEASIQELESAPVAVDLLPICSEDQFHRIIEEAQQAQEPVIVVWMASWCRKCIYLKPKLEKLAAEYHPSLKQLWKDGLKQAEVIGGHKAHLVVNEGRQKPHSSGGNKRVATMVAWMMTGNVSVTNDRVFGVDVKEIAVTAIVKCGIIVSLNTYVYGIAGCGIED
ncbi:Thioredoxin-like 3-2, chloroplastic-like protein [Drosera capensis]